MRGRSRWFPRDVHPVRLGVYECAASVTSSATLTLWQLYWDSAGFVVPFPMVVRRWRGLTRAEHDRLKRRH